MLVAGFHVDQVSSLQRADMRRHDLVRDLLILIIAEDSQHKARGDGRGKRGADGKASKEGSAGRLKKFARSDDLRRRRGQCRFDAAAQARGGGKFQVRSRHGFAHGAKCLELLRASHARRHMRFDVCLLYTSRCV